MCVCVCVCVCAVAHQIYMRCELEKARMEGMEQAMREGEDSDKGDGKA